MMTRWSLLTLVALLPLCMAKNAMDNFNFQKYAKGLWKFEQRTVHYPSQGPSRVVESLTGEFDFKVENETMTGTYWIGDERDVRDLQINDISEVQGQIFTKDADSDEDEFQHMLDFHFVVRAKMAISSSMMPDGSLLEWMFTTPSNFIMTRHAAAADVDGHKVTYTYAEKFTPPLTFWDNYGTMIVVVIVFGGSKWLRAKFGVEEKLNAKLGRKSAPPVRPTRPVKSNGGAATGKKDE